MPYHLLQSPFLAVTSILVLVKSIVKDIHVEVFYLCLGQITFYVKFLKWSVSTGVRLPISCFRKAVVACSNSPNHLSRPEQCTASADRENEHGRTD